MLLARIYLNVSYKEKNEAKELGARWDSGLKLWYVPYHTDISLFEKWFLQDPINLISSNYYISKSTQNCWRCKKITRVYGFILPKGYQSLVAVEDYAEDDEYLDIDSAWHVSDTHTTAYYLEYISTAVRNTINNITDKYYYDRSKTAEKNYWMNHCEHCNIKLGDFQMYEEPQGAFFPTDAQESSKISITLINESFMANGLYAIDLDFDYLPGI